MKNRRKKKILIFCLIIVIIVIIVMLSACLLIGLPLEKTARIILVEKESISIGTESIKYRIVNLSAQTITYGADEWIEQYVDGEWRAVEVLDFSGVDLWALQVLPLWVSREDGCGLSSYRIVETGLYRIAKPIRYGANKANQCIIYGEFLIE